MNILHIEDEPWDSGLAHYALTLAAEQTRHGHRVEFWGRKASPVLSGGKALGLSVRGWPGGARGLLVWPQQRRQAAAFAPRIINAHTGTAHTLALTLAAGRPCAVVRTRGDARPPHANVLTRFVASRTRGFIAANTELFAGLRAAFPNAEIARVPQGLAGPANAPTLVDTPVIGMLARFDPVKGHETLLDAAVALKTRFPALRVRCAGDGRLRERLLWQLKPAGLDGIVSFPGHVPDITPFIAACRIGVVPSLGSEAVSRSTLEWMASGRPVVASRVGGLPDLIEDRVSGLLVPAGDPAALAAALSNLLSDPVKTAAMGRAARRRWEAAFGLDIFYENTQRVYDASSHDLPS